MFSFNWTGVAIGFVVGALACVQVLTAQGTSNAPILDALTSNALNLPTPGPSLRVIDSDCFDNGFEGIAQVTSGVFPGDPDIAVGMTMWWS